MHHTPTTLELSRISFSLSRYALVLAPLFLLIACGGPDLPQMPPPAVLVETVSKKPVHTGFEFVGRTEAVEDVSIRSRIQGYLLKLNFVEGDVVIEGQLLFEIDPLPYEADVARAKADLARAKSEQVVARKNYKRGEELYPKGTISEAEYEELKGKYETSDAVVDAAEAALRSSQLNLGYTKVYAPITGRIGRKTRSLGDLITPSDTLVKLVQEDPVYVIFQVSEKTIVSTMEVARDAEAGGQPVPNLVPWLTLPNGSEYSQAGEINFLDNRVDPATGTVTVRTVFANPDGLLITGQYVGITVRNQNPRRAVVIPQRAVQEDQLGRFVLVVNQEQLAEIRRVRLGSRVKTDWVVEEGLQPGDRIIVDGIQKVRVGAPVIAQDVGNTQAPAPQTLPARG